MSAWTDTTVRPEYPWMAAILIIRNLSPLDNSVWCQIAFPGTVVSDKDQWSLPAVPECLPLAVFWVLPLWRGEPSFWSSLPCLGPEDDCNEDSRSEGLPKERSWTSSMGRNGSATVAELPGACCPGSGRVRLINPDLMLPTSRCLFLPVHRDKAGMADEGPCLHSKTQACRTGKHFREQWECPLRHHLSIINDRGVT